VTSVDDFSSLYGDELPPGNDDSTPYFLWHAVRTFFAEGGTRAYVMRMPDANAQSSVVAYETALRVLEQQDDISIVAAPGATYSATGDPAARHRADAVVDALILHVERMRTRFAVIDAVNGLDVQGVIAQRSRLTSSYAALYYPWIRTTDPLTGRAILLPPSGFVAGVYARLDATRGVWMAPANETVRSAVGLERVINAAERESLQRAGIGDIRAVTNRGIVLWGARTTSDDPEWRYINIRRYAIFLERSISEGLQWAVFEPNGEALWSAVRSAAGDFLDVQWRAGALMGSRAEEAYFVHCDRSTMTEDDLNNGRLICVVGVALQRPAEFVIFRIGLWTASHCP
jgi:phage tail sheath protein FI